MATMTLSDVLHDPPKPHRAPSNGDFILMGLTREPLQFILDHVGENSCTLETGCGISTVAFALAGSRHWTITPSAHEIKIVEQYCGTRSISCGRITFIENISEVALP